MSMMICQMFQKLLSESGLWCSPRHWFIYIYILYIIYICVLFFGVFLFSEVTKVLDLFFEVGRTTQAAQGDALALDCEHRNTIVTI